MTATTNDGDAGGLDAGLDALPRRKFSGKRLVLFVLLPLVLLGGGAAGAYFLGLFDALLGEAPAEEEAVAAPGPADPAGAGIFMPLQDLLVNLSSGSKRTIFLKIGISLELEREEDREVVGRVMPRVLDSFQIFLRELRIEDLKGSAGMYRLREELLMRVNVASYPVRVRDVLFREFLVQ